MIDKKILEEIINTSPLVLLSIRDKEVIDLANSYLPYSTGFEIECEKKPTYNEEIFKNIPNIIWDSYQDSCEQRYRIPNGINGLICLYNICYHLGNNSLLNLGSGIHYHVDCTDTDLSKLTSSFDKDFEKCILSELDEWGYTGTYNKRGTSFYRDGAWIRWNDLKTLEFRLGNMSFDYQVLVKRIIHANNIVFRWKNRIETYHGVISYKEVNYENQIKYQKSIDMAPTSYENRIRVLSEKLIISKPIEIDDNITDNIKREVRGRVHKLY